MIFFIMNYWSFIKRTISHRSNKYIVMFPQIDSQLQGTESCNGFIETVILLLSYKIIGGKIISVELERCFKV